LAGAGLGMVIALSINTGTFGVAPRDAGVASATVTVGQQLGASIGTSLVNTIFAGAVASYLTVHAAPGPGPGPGPRSPRAHCQLHELGRSHDREG
jgi:hypothetical protein